MPPYADNMYSMEDSDDESFSDELSPTDGYFGPSQIRPNVLVPDPSLDHGPVEAKTLIPPPDAESSTGRTSRMSHRSAGLPDLMPSQSQPSRPSSRTTSRYTPASPTSTRHREPSFSEHDQLYIPPPAYSESAPHSLSSFPSSPPRSTNPSQPFNREVYSTFPETHLERGFLPRREPESMGGPVDEPSERAPLISGHTRHGRYSPRRRKVKAVLFAGLMLAILGTTLSVIFGCKSQKGDKSHYGGRGPAGMHNTTYCPYPVTRQDQVVYEFSTGRELSIVQKTHGLKYGDNHTGPTSISTEGEIQLRTSPADSPHGSTPYITVDMGASTTVSEVVLKWSEDSQHLELSTPRYLQDGWAGRSECFYAMITVYLPDNSELTNLKLSSQTLHMALSDVKANVTGRSGITSVSGHVWLDSERTEAISDIDANSTRAAISSKPYSDLPVKSRDLQFSSRRIVVETISGSITGAYPLLDDLILSSQSGSVTVEVAPQPAKKSAPAPADLEVQTASGSIKVFLPIERTREVGYKPFSRDYITRVHSTSGSISGTYYVGSETSLKTTSGTIDITTLPVLPEGDNERTTKKAPNVFETHTVSGTTTVSVLEPVFFSSVSLDHQQPPSVPYQPINDDDPYIVIPPIMPAASSGIEKSDTTGTKLLSLRSAHSSNTGAVKLFYPDAWQGTVHGKTVSGAISVTGDGFRTITSRDGWAFKEVLKRRGVKSSNEGCFVEMSNISGQVAFAIV